MIKQGIILAAGLGQRMRPLTDTLPKPLIEVKGKPIIAYALEMYAQQGLNKVVINTHYKAETLNDYFKSTKWPFEVVLSHEPVLLDTGGGIKQALNFLDASKPVFILSGDSILVDAPHERSLKALENHWTDKTDILLSLQPLSSMSLTPAVGDYKLVNSKPVRTPDHSGDYMWNSARIISPRIFNDTPDGAFSFLPMMDAAQTKGTLAACIHNGPWHHLTTPDDVDAVNKGWSG